MIRHRHFTHDLLALDNFIAVDHRLNVIIMHTGGAANDFRFLFSIGVIDLDVKHEAVLLRLGQLIGAFLFHGVLRSQNKERLLQPVGLAADGDRMLLHGFQQSGLCLWGRAVDLIRQN